jgi:hypothetical protein
VGPAPPSALQTDVDPLLAPNAAPNARSLAQRRRREHEPTLPDTGNTAQSEERDQEMGPAPPPAPVDPMPAPNTAPNARSLAQRRRRERERAEREHGEQATQ